MTQTTMPTVTGGTHYDHRVGQWIATVRCLHNQQHRHAVSSVDPDGLQQCHQADWDWDRGMYRIALQGGSE